MRKFSPKLCRSAKNRTAEPFIELGIFGGTMDGEVSLSGYTLLMMAGFRAGLGATVEVQSSEDVY